MKTLRQGIALALSMVMLLSVSITAHAAEYTPQYTEEAETLYELGLFKGMGTGADGTPIFALEQKATRIQGLVMLIRLLGKEADALAYTGECPFVDVPAWAKCYAAYAYDKGITNGTSATTFSADAPLLGKAYVTFVLRALGYNDAAGDFSYNQALVLGEELGLIGAGECTGEIYRDDCAQISFSALKTAMKDADTKLINKLVFDGVLTEAAVQEAGILNGVAYIPYDKENNRIYADDICAAFPDAACFVSTGDNIPSTGIDWQSPVQQKNLLLISRHVKNYASGESDTLKQLTMAQSEKLYSHGYVTVLDKDYNLIAYFVYPSIDNVGDTLAFTTCFVEGNPEIERVRALLQNIKSYTADTLFYRENITTIHSDGTETVASYLRLDESKLPEYLRENAVYYGTGPGSGDTSLAMKILRKQTAFNNHSTNPSNVTCFQIGEDKSFLAHNCWAFYDVNKDLIGYVTQSGDYPVVETVIDLSGN